VNRGKSSVGQVIALQSVRGSQESWRNLWNPLWR